MDLQRQAEMLDRLLQVVRLLASDPVFVGITKGAVCYCPVLGKRLAGGDLQRQVEVLDRLLKVVLPLASETLDVGSTEVGLCPGPLLREGLMGKDLQRQTEVLDRPLQLFEALEKRTPLWVELAIKEIDGEVKSVQLLRTMDRPKNLISDADEDLN
jgi:hypothetical protein